MVKGNVQIIGTVEAGGAEYPLSILVQFGDKESFKKAIDEGKCEFDLFDEPVTAPKEPDCK